LDFGALRFSHLLKERGYSFWDEDNLDQKITLKGTRPDFYVEAPCCHFLVEVESLKKLGPFDDFPENKNYRRSNMGSLNPKIFLNRIKGPVKEAAKQLKPYSDLNLTCLIVLDNYRYLAISMEAEDLFQLLGNFVLRADYDSVSGSIVDPFVLYHGGDRQLAEDLHNYVSAVAVNFFNVLSYDKDGSISDNKFNVRVIHNPFAQCPLPKETFLDGQDEQWCYRGEGWVRIWPE
jgi:hypothetical protein